MAQMLLEIDSVGGDLENVARAVFHNCVVTVRAPRQPLMVRSVLMLAAGVCANPSATSRAGTTININALFMESSVDSRLAAV
jgi:hypothetical protein